MTRRRVHKKSESKTFEKYELYERAVQSADSDVLFLKKVYRELKGKEAYSLREDFCGTFLLSCEWVKLENNNLAMGLDLDPEPLEYGRLNHLSELSSDEQERLKLIEADVLSFDLPSADLAIAMNFSYFVFKTREQIKTYFQNVFKSLPDDGVFVIDVFGGSDCQDENEEKTIHKDFTYYWHQTNFDPVTHRALFYIHFKLNGQKKQERVFTYDWRMWTIPELREILAEVGFSKTHVYWEGTTKNGEGDGVFTRTEKGESCQSWIAYIASEK